jgi:1,4-dihydroxy-6-naphthoate synthase
LKLSLGFSPCPNDTFIFDALVNHKIDTEGLEFDVRLEDVQTLNQWAIQGKLDVSKISYGVLPLILENYIVLNSGGALGVGVGPLLISKSQWSIVNGEWVDIKHPLSDINTSTIAIPGKNTTAHFLFSLAFPNAKNKVFLRFDEIEQFVADGKGLGVIIHENRFTYKEKGLFKVVDLGDFWEQETGNPIPLGGIVANKKLHNELHQKLDRLIKKSLEYSFSNYPELTDYIRSHAQEMSESVMRQHIDLYVNDYSLALGEKGKSAVKKLMEVAAPDVKMENIFSLPNPPKEGLKV